MSGCSTEKKDYDKSVDYHNIKPYGDTMNDGKVQMSFTLPVPANEKGVEAALVLARKLGLKDPAVPHYHSLDKEFSFYVVYGEVTTGIDYDSIKVQTLEIDVMDMYETEEYIAKNIGRDIVIVGASTGTDAHTVGIDAVMNMKGYAGHYGLERYKGIEAYNLGSQVPNEEFIKKADVVLFVHQLQGELEANEVEFLKDVRTSFGQYAEKNIILILSKVDKEDRSKVDQIQKRVLEQCEQYLGFQPQCFQISNKLYQQGIQKHKDGLVRHSHIEDLKQCINSIVSNTQVVRQERLNQERKRYDTERQQRQNAERQRREQERQRTEDRRKQSNNDRKQRPDDQRRDQNKGWDNSRQER